MARKKQEIKQEDGQEPIKKVKKKNEGKVFEQSFQDSWSFSDFIYRLRDSGSSFSKSEATRFTASNVCDYFAYHNGQMYLLELKSTAEKRLAFSNIRPFQLKGLYEYGKKEGVNSFFIVNFRCVNETYAIEADKIYNVFDKGVKKSVNLDWCRKNGTIIGQTIKRTKYVYTIQDLFNIVEGCQK